MEFFGITHQGMVRSNNEDSFIIYEQGIGSLPNLAIVADGMGGHQSGEVASMSSIHFFVEHVESCKDEVSDIMDLLNESVQYSNAKVYDKSLSSSELFGMGTTFTACTVSENRIFAAHVGDSRLYLISDSHMELLTTDHTYVHEMVKAGLLTLEESLTDPRRNALTKALGVGAKIEVDGYCAPLDEFQAILMCSDGLTTMLSDEEIFSVIKSLPDLQDASNALINLANEKGGVDNITVILAKVKR